MNRIKILDYAEKWLNLNQIETILDRDREKLSVIVNDMQLDLSDDEVEYRAELYLESELQELKN